MRVGEVAERGGVNVENTLRQTALGGAVLPWQELLRARARFLADCGWGDRQALLSSLERRDRQLLEALPAPADGLSGTERRALQVVAADGTPPS